MKNKFSLLALVFILICFLIYRIIYFENNSKNGYNATTWDAFGYYLYLPSVFIYEDVKELKWIPGIDSTYHVTGGKLYQAIHLKNGNYTGKYLCGVAIIESPFFFLGHGIAYFIGEPQDGFSWSYQYSIIFGAIFWCFIGFIFIRKVLLKYFDDKVSALTLILIGLTSNLIQYVSKDSAMSHAFIFPLYAIILWLTIKWHENPKWNTALLIGITCGLATICRSTELIMIFIPIFWDTNTKVERTTKWEKIIENKSQVLLCVLGGVIGILPQVLYWKYSTGYFIFDVGSKWVFFNPWFRVLLGPESGWFLYTPVAILMVLGFFFMKKKPFRNAVLIFCLLNIWIIISWFDWKYGATYSTRALTQSYPIFALSLACFIGYCYRKHKQVVMYILVIFLIVLNFYQLSIYNNEGMLVNFSPFLKMFR